MNEILIQAKDLVKTYNRGSEVIHAVDHIDFTLRQGDFVSVTGPSGSGKTTLINLLGALDNPTSGELMIGQYMVFNEKTLSHEKKLSIIRREKFGYIFQKFFLIPTLTVKENIYLPHTFYQKKGNSKDFDEILDFLGINHRLNHLPSQLSGGEMQRVAIARALVNEPSILLADEPTGNLDTKRSDEIGQLLRDLNSRLGISVILVTHNLHLAEMAKTKIEIQDGKIHSIKE